MLLYDDITSASALAEAKRVWESLRPEAVNSHARQRWPDGRAENIAARLLRGCMFDERTGCMPWTKASQSEGYGVIGVGRASLWRTHRLSWVLFVAPVPDALSVLHKCDHPPCFNPAHLFVGDQLANVRDAQSKGRTCCGAANGQSKLCASDIQAVRVSNESQVSLASRYGVNQSTISRIRAGKRWQSVLTTTGMQNGTYK